MKAQSLEWTILKAIARVRPDDWLPCSLGDLRVRMRDIEADALNASMNSIVEACIFLLENGYILLGKREDAGKRLPFDPQKQSNEGYYLISSVGVVSSSSSHIRVGNTSKKVSQPTLRPNRWELGFPVRTLERLGT